MNSIQAKAYVKLCLTSTFPVSPDVPIMVVGIYEKMEHVKEGLPAPRYEWATSWRGKALAGKCEVNWRAQGAPMVRFEQPYRRDAKGNIKPVRIC